MSDVTGASGGADGEGRPTPALPGQAGATGTPAVGESDPRQGRRTTVTDTTRPPHHKQAVRQQETNGGGTPMPAPQPPPQPHQPPQAYSPPPGGDSKAEGTTALRRPRPAAAAAAAGTAAVPRTRKARLRVAKADPWSVMKVSFLLSIALGICTVVAVAVLWMVLDAIGVFSTVGDTLKEATGSGTDGGFDLVSFLSLSRVVTFTSLIAVIDVVLVTALGTLGAFAYNLTAGFVGGIELTLAEDE